MVENDLLPPGLETLHLSMCCRVGRLLYSHRPPFAFRH